MRRALAGWLLACGAAGAQEPVFDMHVHLREGEASLREYTVENAAAGIASAGVGAMWFGGPHQAPAGDPARIRARNDALIGLAKRSAHVLPIGTVHPYDGDEALDELARIAGQGVRVVKIHAHTQRFDVADPRVLALVQRAGELGMVVLMDNAGILPGDHEKLFNLAAAAPRTRLVLAHIGGTGFRFWNILALARTADGFGFENLYFDISATVLLAESHLCVHTWPEQKAVTLDVYVCNFGADHSAKARGLMFALVHRFQPEWTEQRSLDRGEAA